jgi:hypothetical protein
MMLAANDAVWTQIKYLGFYGVLPESVAAVIRRDAGPKPKEETNVVPTT